MVFKANIGANIDFARYSNATLQKTFLRRKYPEREL